MHYHNKNFKSIFYLFGNYIKKLFLVQLNLHFSNYFIQFNFLQTLYFNLKQYTSTND